MSSTITQVEHKTELQITSVELNCNLTFKILFSPLQISGCSIPVLVEDFDVSDGLVRVDELQKNLIGSSGKSDLAKNFKSKEGVGNRIQCVAEQNGVSVFQALSAGKNGEFSSLINKGKTDEKTLIETFIPLIGDHSDHKCHTKHDASKGVPCTPITLFTSHSAIDTDTTKILKTLSVDEDNVIHGHTISTTGSFVRKRVRIGALTILSESDSAELSEEKENYDFDHESKNWSGSLYNKDRISLHAKAAIDKRGIKIHSIRGEWVYGYTGYNESFTNITDKSMSDISLTIQMLHSVGDPVYIEAKDSAGNGVIIVGTILSRNPLIVCEHDIITVLEGDPKCISHSADNDKPMHVSQNSKRIVLPADHPLAIALNRDSEWIGLRRNEKMYNIYISPEGKVHFSFRKAKYPVDENTFCRRYGGEFPDIKKLTLNRLNEVVDSYASVCSKRMNEDLDPEIEVKDEHVLKICRKIWVGKTIRDAQGKFYIITDWLDVSPLLFGEFTIHQLLEDAIRNGDRDIGGNLIVRNSIDFRVVLYMLNISSKVMRPRIVDSIKKTEVISGPITNAETAMYNHLPPMFILDRKLDKPYFLSGPTFVITNFIAFKPKYDELVKMGYTQDRGRYDNYYIKLIEFGIQVETNVDLLNGSDAFPFILMYLDVEKFVKIEKYRSFYNIFPSNTRSHYVMGEEYFNSNYSSHKLFGFLPHDLLVDRLRVDFLGLRLIPYCCENPDLSVILNAKGSGRLVITMKDHIEGAISFSTNGAGMHSVSLTSNPIIKLACLTVRYVDDFRSRVDDCLTASISTTGMFDSCFFNDRCLKKGDKFPSTLFNHLQTFLANLGIYNSYTMYPSFGGDFVTGLKVVSASSAETLKHVVTIDEKHYSYNQSIVDFAHAVFLKNMNTMYTSRLPWGTFIGLKYKKKDKDGTIAIAMAFTPRCRASTVTGDSRYMRTDSDNLFQVARIAANINFEPLWGDVYKERGRLKANEIESKSDAV